MRGRRALLLLLVIACWRLGPSAAQPKPGAGGKKLLLPDVAPTLLDIQAKGSANPGARPLAELNDRHSTTRQKTKKKSFPMAGVTQVGTSPHGSTVQLTAHLDAKKANVYALAGATGANVDGHDRVMKFPAAFQVATPFGTDIGGVAPAFFAVNPDCQYDSWLTVGVTDGSAAGGLATSPGLGLDKWTADAAFRTTDGAVRQAAHPLCSACCSLVALMCCPHCNPSCSAL